MTKSQVTAVTAGTKKKDGTSKANKIFGRAKQLEGGTGAWSLENLCFYN